MGKIMRRVILNVLNVLLLALAMTAAAMAADVVKPFKAEADLIRYAFHYELLDTVLRRTAGKYGPYVMQPYSAPISVARGLQEGIRGEILNLLISDAGHKIIDEGMIPIPYPLDKGLIGYRIALIRKQDQARIGRINSIEQLRSLTVGQGRDWGDVKVFEFNRIPLDTSSTDYDSLFAMLARGRFDLFPRGATEVKRELEAYGGKYPDLAIERHLLIKYSFAQFFYVSKAAPRLAARLKDGLEQMVRDGSFDALFDKHFARALSELDLGHRIVIELDNPYLPAWVPLKRKELWFDYKK